MKKIAVYFLLSALIVSFTILFLEYNEYLDKKKTHDTLKIEINKTYNKLSNISNTIYELKLEEEKISNEKEKEINQYQKWIRQNQILKDLLK